MTELFPAEIRTERLRLVRESVADADLGERYEARNEAAVEDGELEYIPIEPFVHLEEAREFVAAREERMESGNAGTYVVRPREGEDGAGEPAGDAEIYAIWDRQAAFFTFGLRKRFWGRGYSGERAAAFVRLAFERLDLDVVFVTHVVGNENSRRAIGKYVDRFDGDRVGRLRNIHKLDGDPQDVVHYEITRSQYEASGDRPDCEFIDDPPDGGASGGEQA